MFKKLIHILFLPCNEATMLMEKQNAGNTSSKENWRLFMHLKICKWCMAYKKKLELLDEILKGKLFNEQKNEIKEFEIQGFKEKNLKKLDI